MADPNFAAVAEMMSFASSFANRLEVYTSTASTGLIAQLEAFRNDLEGDYGQAARTPIERARLTVNGAITRSAMRAMFLPLLRQMAVAINYPDPNASLEVLHEALFDYCIAQSQSINDSEDTIDTSYSAGGSNVGNGEVIVLTVDEENGKLGGWIPDSWTLECMADARQLGELHKEQWRLEGTDRRPDNLDFTGSGLVVNGLRTFAADLSESYVTNASFNRATLDGSTLTSLPGWTQNTGAAIGTNLSINTSNTYRTSPGDANDRALQFNADELLYQDIVNTGGARINPNLPYLIDVAVAKVGTPTGTMSLRLSDTLGSGGVSASLAHGAMTGSGTYDRLRIAVGQNCWPAQFNANTLRIQIQLSSGASIDASNYFLVDDLIFAPFARVGAYGDPRTGRGAMGIYMAILGGSTPFVKGDTFTAADSEGGTRGVFHWAYSRIAQIGYLPLQTGGTETIADK